MPRFVPGAQLPQRLFPRPLAVFSTRRRNANADVFFFPSILEGHPQVLGQAAACGLPAVAMNVYRPDYVLHGETGFLAESDVELTQKLDMLLRDSELRQSMASAAARHSRKFDWDQITEQWIRGFSRCSRATSERLVCAEYFAGLFDWPCKKPCHCTMNATTQVAPEQSSPPAVGLPRVIRTPLP